MDMKKIATNAEYVRFENRKARGEFITKLNKHSFLKLSAFVMFDGMNEWMDGWLVSELHVVRGVFKKYFKVLPL